MIQNNITVFFIKLFNDMNNGIEYKVYIASICISIYNTNFPFLGPENFNRLIL